MLQISKKQRDAIDRLLGEFLSVDFEERCKYLADEYPETAKQFEADAGIAEKWLAQTRPKSFMPSYLKPDCQA